MAPTSVSQSSASGDAVRIAHDNDDQVQREVHAPPPRRHWIPVLALLVLISVAGGGWYWWKHSKPDDSQGLTTAPSAPVLPETPDVVPAPRHYPPPVIPVEQKEAKPLPSLDQSDGLARDALVELVGSETIARLLSTQDLVRHIVVTVDNLPRKTVAPRLNPVKPAGGEFKVGADGQRQTISGANAARYAPYVELASRVDAGKLVHAYGRLYPLFQKAYEDLGYPKQFFNDRLIAVIDHLLAAPDVAGPIAVVAPHVQYQFADPELEAQSAGRKLLLRAGPENSAALKAKLREIRRELTKTVK